MRFPTIAKDYWELRSGEKAHSDNPSEFLIPSIERRKNLHVGQAAKLIFDLELENEKGELIIEGERMWVIVSEASRDHYIGILDNQPAACAFEESVYLKFGAEVPFKAEHIIDIDEPPKDHVEWQLGQEPENKWYGRNEQP